MREFLSSLLANPRAAVRSAATTVLGVAGTLLGLAALVESLNIVELPNWWVQGVVFVTAVASAARTLIAAVDPKNDSFGRGA